ncbi:MAG: porin [Alcanivorax sp.]|nr:porin [Alcanivorax sp.]
MNKPSNAKGICRLAILAGVLATTPVLAAESADLDLRVKALEHELQSLKQQMNDTRQQSETAAMQSRGDTSLAKFQVGGYGTAGYTASDQAIDAFDPVAFNPIFEFQYGDDWLFAAELELEANEEGETETKLEFATATWLANDYMAIQVGKWLSPFGQFQDRLHPSWINKLPDAPVGYGEHGVLPLSEVGAQVRGGIPLGRSIINYVVGVGNGPKLGDQGATTVGLAADNNNNKSLTGRLGIIPVPNVEVGASFMNAKITGDDPAGTPCDAVGPGQACFATTGDYTLWGADVAITPGPLDLRGEYTHAQLKSINGRLAEGDNHTIVVPKTTWKIWYVQMAYQLRGLSESVWLDKWEPVVRYGEMKVDGYDGFAGDAQKRWDVGLNYLFTPTIIGKLAWEQRNYDDPATQDEKLLMMQLAFGF